MVRRKGERFKLTCKKCGSMKMYYFRDITAKNSLMAMIIASIILFIGTPFILVFLWDNFLHISFYGILKISGLIVIQSWIYWIMNKNDRERVNSFN